ELALAGAVEDVLLIGEDAAELRMGAEDFSQHEAVAAADVHEALPCAEVVGCGYGRSDELGHCGHGVVEDAREFGVAAKLIKAVVVGEEFGGALAGLETAGHLAEAGVTVVAAPEDEERAKRTGKVGAQEVGDVGVAEAAVGVLFK